MNSDVGTRKLYENDDIIMWEFLLEPGEATSCHTHVHDYVWYVVEGSALEVFDENNQLLAAFEAPTGAIVPLKLDGGELVSPDGQGPRAAATHSARNAGTTRYREILVETKRR
jgi:hypothetical protein